MQLLTLSILSATAVLANDLQIKGVPFPSISLPTRRSIGPQIGLPEPVSTLDVKSCQFACQMLMPNLEHYSSKDPEDFCKPDTYLQLFYATCVRCDKFIKQYEDVIFAVTSVCGLPFAGDGASYVAENLSVASCEPFLKKAGHQHKRRHESHVDHSGHDEDVMKQRHSAQLNDPAEHDMIMDDGNQAGEPAGHDMEMDQSGELGQHRGSGFEIDQNDIASQHAGQEGHMTDMDDKVSLPADLANEIQDEAQKVKSDAAPAPGTKHMSHVMGHRKPHGPMPTGEESDAADIHEKKQIQLLDERVKEYMNLCGPFLNSSLPTNGTIPNNEHISNGTLICIGDCECNGNGDLNPDCQPKAATPADDCEHASQDTKGGEKGKPTPVGFKGPVSDMQEQANGVSRLSTPGALCFAFGALFI